jgi:glycosyltransferase involved in cell wall biosynthesis
VVVPAFNEEDALPATLKELREATVDLDVVVVDDGSTDATSVAARDAGAALLRLPYNVGVGAAVRAGLRYASEQGVAATVVLDADGQHDAGAVDELLDALAAGADVVIGSRFAPGAPDFPVPRTRRRAMRFLTWIVRRITHLDLTDVSSGFRAFDRAATELLARDYPVEYLADTVEVLLLCHAAGMRIVEIPVTMRTRAGGRPSSRSWKIVVNYLRLLIGIASWRWRSVLPPPRSRERRSA